MTLGEKPPRRWPPPSAMASGSLMISMARARCGRRRMNPRSSRAMIRRCTPDLDCRLSASFISSKDGGTPVSCSRSLMKVSSSFCLLVSMGCPRAVGGQLKPAVQIRNILDVPKMFRNSNTSSFPRSVAEAGTSRTATRFCADPASALTLAGMTSAGPYAGNWAAGVEREIATSSGVISAGMAANSGVER